MCNHTSCAQVQGLPKSHFMMMYRRAHGFNDNIIYGIYTKYIRYIDIFIYTYIELQGHLGVIGVSSETYMSQTAKQKNFLSVLLV